MVVTWAVYLPLDAALRTEPARIVDLGKFPAESNQVATFTLFNMADTALRVASLESCCFMLEPVIYEKTIAPGGSTPLDVLIDANTLVGPFEKYISLTTTEPERQTRQLWIKGTALPAISTPSPHIFAGWSPLSEPWSTNLTIAVRNGLPGKLTAIVQSNTGLDARITRAPDSGRLQLTIPPQSRPMHWQGMVYLQVEGNAQIRPTAVHLEGFFGGSLLPVPKKLQLAGDGPAQATITLYRKNPSTGPAIPAPLQCSIPTIEIKENPCDTGGSTVTLKFPARFMKRLKNEKRILIELRAAGCIPATIPVEWL